LITPDMNAAQTSRLREPDPIQPQPLAEGKPVSGRVVRKGEFYFDAAPHP